MNISVEITDADVERIARRVAELLDAPASKGASWLDVAGAANYLAMSTHSIRALVKRKQIPSYRTENGRVRFNRAELDAWARSDTGPRPCVRGSEDLP